MTISGIAYYLVDVHTFSNSFSCNKVYAYSNDFGVLPFQITIFIVNGTREMQHLPAQMIFPHH